MRYQPWLLVLLPLSMVGCSQTPTTPTTSTTTTTAPASASTPTRADLDACVADVNRYRGLAGKSVLVGSSALESFTQAAAQSDSATNSPHDYYLHHAVGASAENELLRQSVSSASNAFLSLNALSWQEGPGGGHYENLIGPWSAVGCGAVRDGQVWTAVIDFR